MAQGLETDLRQLVLDNGAFGPREIEQMVDAIAEDFSCYRTLREAVGELELREDQSPASNVRLGVCLYLLGRNRRAVAVLQQGDGGALAHFYMAKAYFALEEYQRPSKATLAAGRAGYDSDQCVLGRAEAQRVRAATRPRALATLDELSGAVEQTAEYLYQRGATVAALGGNPEEVVALYERAVEADRSHAGALFGLALENDRRGNDDDGAGTLQQAVGRRFPPMSGRC